MRNKKHNGRKSLLTSKKGTARFTSFIAATLVVTLLLGGTTIAFLTDSTGPLVNIFSKGPKYTLTYHANAGSENVTVPEKQVEYGNGTDPVDFTVSPDKPLREGFVFTGWNTEDEGTGTDYNPNDIFTAPADQRNSDLYAKWEGGYTLIYDANGGANAPEAQTKISGDPTCTFDNLAEQGDMTGPLQADGTSSHRVFLGWSLEKNPSSGEPSHTRDGKLAYDNTALDYDKTKVDGFDTEVLIDSAVTPSKTVTLYAVWATKYELKYSLHPKLDGSHEPLPDTQTCVTVNDSHSFVLPAGVPGVNIPTRERKYYWGWWSDQNPYEEDGVTLNDTEVFDPSSGFGFTDTYKPLSKDKPYQTLYACFQPPDLSTLNYDINNPDIDKADVENWPTFSRVSSTETTYNPRIPDAPISHPRYRFLGWTREPGGTEVDPKIVSGQIYSINKYIECDVTLYAVWDNKHKFALNFNQNGGNYVYYQDDNGSGTRQWTRKSSSTYHKTGSVWYEDDFQKESEYYNEMSRTWDSDFWSDRGLFAVKNEDSYGEYKFMGWSFKQYPTRGAGEYREGDPENYPIDFPVIAPADPANPTGDEGIIKSDVALSEETDGKCTSPSVHRTELYAVWRRSPKHRFRLTFDRGNGSSITGTTNFYSANATLAAVDHEEYTWTASAKDGWGGWSSITNHPIATKNETDIESYKLVGWAWDKNAETPDFRVDETTKRIIDDIKLEEEAEDILDCVGGDHQKTLYPIFEPVPHHKFQITFYPNAPKLDNLQVRVKYKNTNGSWNSSSSTKSYKSEAVDLGDKTYNGWNEEFWSKNGVYASCKNTKLQPGEEQKFTFLGWSWKEDGSTLDFPVNAPDNPDAYPAATDVGVGIIDGTVSVTERAEDECTDTGKLHEYKLYGVWEYDRLHQYTVIFTGNGDGSKIRYIDSNGNWKADSGSTIKKDTVDFDDGPLAADIKNCWTYSSPAIKVPTASPTEEYTFDGADWKANNIGVSAERASTDKYRYEFVGWSKRPVEDALDNTSKVDYYVDSEGYLISAVTIKDNDTANCSLNGPEKHYDVLYAVWNRIPIHKYSIVFTANSGHRIMTYLNGTEWKSTTTGSINKNNLPDVANSITDNYLYNYWRLYSDEIDLSAGETEYTFPANEWKDNNIGVKAEKNNAGGKRYKFKGWSTTPQNPGTVEHPASVDYHVNDDGFIIDPITVPNSGTEYDIHNLVLYAVWEESDIPPEPFKHSYTINFNYNAPSGDSTPSWYTRYRVYNGAAWIDNNQTSGGKSFRYPATGQEDISVMPEFTIPASEWENYGMGAKAYVRDDINTYPCSYEFLGWSSERKAPSLTASAADCDVVWEQDPNSAIQGDGFIKSPITITCNNHERNHDHVLTLYAVWKIIPRTKTYKLEFDLNKEGAQGLPAPMNGEEVYDGVAWKDKCPFTMPETFDVGGTLSKTPKYKSLVFTGWAESPDAIQGSYGYPNDINHEIYDITVDNQGTYNMRYIGEKDTDIKTLYAIWWYEYYLRYDGNGTGVSNTPKFDHAYSSSTMYPFTTSKGEPTRPGYNFLGWSRDPGATTPEVSVNERYEVNAITSGENEGYTDVTLYAVWEEAQPSGNDPQQP